MPRLPHAATVTAAILLLACACSSEARAVVGPNLKQKARGLKRAPGTRTRPQEQIRWAVMKWPDGKIRKKTPYKGSKIHGTVEEYFRSGKLKAKTPHAEGVLQGVAQTWFESGRLASQIPRKAGKIDGVAEHFFDASSKPPGKRVPRSIERHDAAKGLHGKCEYWSAPGVREKTLNYVDGKLHGVCEYF
ncbi:MAG: toxin-antitoxin system YwqK family antitoxin, partial [Planctomycetota bacterium]